MVYNIVQGVLLAENGLYGFRVRRGAAAVVLVVRLITELAATTGTTLARCRVDLKGFFMGICREFLYRLERAVGVERGDHTYNACTAGEGVGEGDHGAWAV